jgi:hypothetical protein
MNIKNIFSGIFIVYIVQGIMTRPLQTLLIATGSFYVGRVVEHPSLDYAEEKITEKIAEAKEFISHVEKDEKTEEKSFSDKAWSAIENFNPFSKKD